MKVRLMQIERCAENMKTYWFSKPANVHHVAGQFTEIYLPHKNPDARGERRWFTLSSSPSEPMLAISTKIYPLNSTFKKALEALDPNTRLDLAEPMGDFVLPKDASLPLLFVAGGIGITPYRSIVKYLIDGTEKRDIILLYSASSENHIAFQEILNYLKPNFKKVIGQRLSSSKILELVPDAERRHIYLSGPEPMVERLYGELTGSGFDKANLYTDYFHGYPEF